MEAKLSLSPYSVGKQRITGVCDLCMRDFPLDSVKQVNGMSPVVFVWRKPSLVV